jgi:uncharacterized membrane protein HdeD (DUF308 family)
MYDNHRDYREPRLFRFMAYLSVTLAGVFTMFFDSKAVDKVAPEWTAYVWGIFMILGGVVSAVSLLRKSWAGELIGLPLQASAHGFYGTVVLLSYPFFGDGAFLFVGTLFLAFSLLTADRWLRFWRISKIHLASEKVDGDE